MDLEDLPRFEKTKRPNREVRHGKQNHYFRRNSCIGKKTFPDLEAAKEYRQWTANYIKSLGIVPDKVKIYECPFCKKFHTAHIEEVR